MSTGSPLVPANPAAEKDGVDRDAAAVVAAQTEAAPQGCPQGQPGSKGRPARSACAARARDGAGRQGAWAGPGGKRLPDPGP